MKNGKTILYIVLILFVLVLIVLLSKYRKCENNKQRISDYLASPSGTPPTTQEIIEGSKPCQFWSF